jgi:hypothetical protein
VVAGGRRPCSRAVAEQNQAQAAPAVALGTKMHWGGPEVTARTRPANDCLPGVQIKVREADQGRPTRPTKADEGTVGEWVSTV